VVRRRKLVVVWQRLQHGHFVESLLPSKVLMHEAQQDMHTRIAPPWRLFKAKSQNVVAMVTFHRQACFRSRWPHIMLYAQTFSKLAKKYSYLLTSPRIHPRRLGSCGNCLRCTRSVMKIYHFRQIFRIPICHWFPPPALI